MAVHFTSVGLSCVEMSLNCEEMPKHLSEAEQSDTPILTCKEGKDMCFCVKKQHLDAGRDRQRSRQTLLCICGSILGEQDLSLSQI